MHSVCDDGAAALVMSVAVMRSGAASSRWLELIDALDAARS